MILKAPGGKLKAAKDLLPLLPERFREYREPFAYSAGMFWHIPPGKRRWLNDLNPIIAKVYARLRDDATFAEEIISLREKYPTAFDIESFWEEAKRRYSEDDDPLAFIFLTRFAHYSIVSPTRSDICSFSAHNLCGLTPLTRERVEWCRDRLQGVTVTTADYAVCLDAPGDDVLVFLDPPYLPRSHEIYQHGFYKADYYALSERLRRTSHKFMLTIGCGKFEQDLFSGGEFNVLRLSHVGSRFSMSRGNIHRYLVVTNYPFPRNRA
jgi:DNA adenine methylase